ncbi:transporter [Parahaliea aestuarii]|uniref:Transporter n=1 Tax=Parahaliea aestuarii TaxID=1852021 RepID=A0A5C9A2C0_9GAMM|nr:transporter [Parahaliea aestuarii]TXS94866.1 transporter [Parahaliea aestuarii]
MTSQGGVSIALVVALALLAGVTPVAAQELTPRAYWPAPVGTQLLTLGVSYTDGDTVPDPSLPIVGVDSGIVTATAGYTRFFSLAGRTASFFVQQPYSDGNTRAEHELLGDLERDYQGVGDITAGVSFNLLGAPAMNLQQFGELRHAPRPILGASFKVVAPTGNYDTDRLINVGANRWAAKAELGYIQPLAPSWLLELDVGVWGFDNNSDFVGYTREQDPIYSAQLHLIKRFGPGFWGSVNLNGYHGGRSTVGGRELDDLQRDTKAGFTLVFPFAGTHAIKASFATGSVNDSDESFDVYQLSYQRVF